MEGEHLLDSKGSVQVVVINNADNLTLRGESGHSNTDVIIRCSSNTRGLEFNNGNIINIYDVSITGCGQRYIDIATLYIHHIMLYNNRYYPEGILYIHCVTDSTITITDSTFTNNTVGRHGGLYIYGRDNNTYYNYYK